MDYKEFSSKIKSKYPDYADMDDLELAKKIVSKYPDDYSDVTFDAQPEPQQQTQEPEIYTREWIGPQIARRRQEAIDKFQSGSPDVLSPVINLAGDIAGTATGTVSRAFEPVTKPIGQAISKITPEPIKKGLGQALSFGSGQFKKMFPNEKQQELIGSMGNIAGAATIATPFKAEATTLASKAIQAPIKTTGKALQLPDKLAGKLAQETSGVSEEALRMAGTKQGREALKGAYGKQYEIGENLVDAIDNAWDVIPKSAEIKETLRKVPYVNVQPILTKLRTSIPSTHTGEMKGVADKLNQKADELAELTVKYGDSGNVPADKLFEFRQEIDNIIGDSWEKESGKYVSALKATRKSIKESLINTSKGTEYEPQMQDLAKKLDALDKIKQVVGKTSDSRELRAKSIIRNINSLDNEKKREWMQNFQDVFGGDFLNQAKMAQLAEQMGNEGAGTWLPRWTTGRSTLAKGVGLTFGSPKVASQITLPATKKVSDVGKKVEKFSEIFTDLTEEEKQRIKRQLNAR